jgi:hypothetical protein
LLIGLAVVLIKGLGPAEDELFKLAVVLVPLPENLEVVEEGALFFEEFDMGVEVVDF